MISRLLRQTGLKTLDIYIIKKFLGTFFFALILIVTVAIVFDLSEKLDNFIEKEAPFRAIVFDYYLNFAPYFAILFSYLFTFITVIFFTSKMAYNTEIIAMLSNGVSFNRLLVPYMVSAGIIAVFSFMFSNYVIPPANKNRFEFEERYYRGSRYIYQDRNIHKQIEPGVFMYMENYSNHANIGYKFALEKFEDGELKSKLIADYIVWDTLIQKWTIHQYRIRNFNGKYEEIIRGREIDTILKLDPSDFNQRDNVIEAMNLPALNTYINELELQGSTNINQVLIERGKRFSYPFSTFILTLLGVSISSRKIRGGMGGHLGFGVAISFAYILFMQFSAQFAIGGKISPGLACWIPNFIFSIVALAAYKVAPK